MYTEKGKKSKNCSFSPVMWSFKKFGQEKSHLKVALMRAKRN